MSSKKIIELIFDFVDEMTSNMVVYFNPTRIPNMAAEVNHGKLWLSNGKNKVSARDFKCLNEGIQIPQLKKIFNALRGESKV